MGNVPKSGGIMQWFTGTIDFDLLANGLAKLASKKVINFYNTISTLKSEVFTNTTAFFKSLADIGNVPQSGGLMQWFSGTIDFDLLANGLAKLASEKVINFYNTIAGLDSAVFTNTSAFFKSLADIGNVPVSGGLTQWFSGTIDFDLLADGLSRLAGEDIINFYKTIATLESATFTNTGAFFKSLADIGNVPQTGGLMSWFSGTIDFDLLANGLSKLAGEKVQGFYTTMENFSLAGATKAKMLFSSLGNLPKSGGISEFFCGSVDFDKIAEGLGKLAGDKVVAFYNTMDALPLPAFYKAEMLFQSLGEIANIPKSGGIGDFFGGSIDFDKLAEGVGKLAGDKVTGFLTKMQAIDSVAFTNAKALFQCLGGIDALPKDGGITQWFTGTVDYDKLSSGLGSLCNYSVMLFFKRVSELNNTAFSNARTLFECLGGIDALPKDGGVVQWFTGTVDYNKLSTGLGTLASEGVVKFFNMVSELPRHAFENTTALFKCLSGINALPKEDGALQLLSGEINLSTVGEELKAFGESTKGFFEQINNLNVENLNGLWNSLKKAKDVTGNVMEIVDEHIDRIIRKMTELPKQMGDSLKKSGHALSDSFVSIWKEAVKATTKPVNKLIEGANWVLKEFGSKKRVVSWTPYAKGTNGHKGGNALVNDGRGAELVQMPNGNSFIPQGKNVFIPNAPQGMKVLSAEHTAQLMGKSSPTFRYADGVGDIDIWSYIDNAKGLIGAVTKKYVNYKGVSGLASNISKGLVSTVSGQMSSWAEKLFDEFGAMSIAAYNPSKGVEQWRSTVIKALKMEGQYSASNVARTLYQMQTESGGNPRAINLWDSNAKAGIPSKGLMQVIDPTFKAYARAGFDKNIYDPLSNILASIRYAVSRYGSLANAYRGVVYANGGLATKPSVFGEDGAEMAIPLSASKRKRGIDLWQKTGDMFGLSSYTPENSVCVTNNTTNNEYNTYSPQFVLNMNGSTDRATERTVKQWIKEALEESYASIGRSNYELQEV